MGVSYKHSDFIGKKFGKLTVISAHQSEKRGQYWNCVCECGNELVCVTTYLKSRSADTRCKKCPVVKPRWSEDEFVGKRFGKLTVLRLAERGNDRRWECLCDCGNNLTVSTHVLKTRNINALCPKCRRVKYVNHGEYVEGTLPNGKTFKIDVEDYDKCLPYQWNSDRKGYILCWYPGKNEHVLRLHNLVRQPAPGCTNDHINRDKSDNRKSNLRDSTPSENSINRRRRTDNSSGYVGVQLSSHKTKWYAFITRNKRRVYIGSFATAEEALQARIEAEKLHYGEFAPQV